jgi:hypothetical protein
MELYALNEEELFNYLKDNFYPDMIRDATIYASNELQVIAGLKCKTTHYDELMIDKSVYDTLKKEASWTGYTPVYICSTPDGIYEFNLEILSLVWREKMWESSGRGLYKLVALLPIKNAKNLSINLEIEWGEEGTGELYDFRDYDDHYLDGDGERNE